MNTLTLALKGVYFDQIVSGEKHFEYRLRTPYWTKRMEKAPFDRLVLTRGYPQGSDEARRLVLPWRGYVLDAIQHEHFGTGVVAVFSIIVSNCDVSERCVEGFAA